MIAAELIRKRAAEEIAEVIASAGINGAGIMERLKEFESREKLPFRPVPGNYIGIWKEIPELNLYVRDENLAANWYRWADHNKIPVIAGRKRVLLTGESAARGSFYSNEYSPARILEHILSRITGDGSLEVIDITKSGMEPDEMTATLRNAAVLRPDQVVIMAGNNFFYKLYQHFLTTALEGHSTYRRSGEWLKKHVDEALAKYTLSFLHELQSLFTGKQVPVLFVIPAFNLGDWKATSAEKLPPCLPPEEMKDWEKLLGIARRALAAADYIAVQTAVSQLLDLCPVHPTPHELLGEAALAHQDRATARKHLEIARDLTLLFRSIGKPRILSVVRNTILHHAGEYGISITDLSQIFEQHTSQPVPGRDLFMDYCHMNIEGIRLSMASVAASVAGTLQLPFTAAGTIERIAAEIQPCPKEVCMAHIYAAIHNAHYGQEYPIVRHHIETAFSCAPELAARFCQLYIEMATVRLSSPLTRSFVRMLDDAHIRIDQYPQAVFHPANGKLLDILLTDAMNDVLVEKGIIGEQVTADLRLSEHAVELGPVNLLESYYSRRTYDRCYNEGTHFYKSRDTRSVFSFFTHACSALICEIVYRVKDGCTGHLELTINGEPLTQLPATHEWQTGFLRVGREKLVRGENSLVITWPVCERPDDHAAAASVEEMISLLAPVRGELHGFTIWV